VDRKDAGRRLAALLSPYQGAPALVVLGLPRGGVPVAYEVARALGAPLDVFTARKLGVPRHEELAMGAIATGGACVLNEDVIRQLGIPASEIERVRIVEQAELERRERTYRGDRPPLDAHGSTVILVDDGLATGATMRAAVAALRLQHPAKIVVAVPVASREACAALRAVADACVCAATPPAFYGVGAWYDDFGQTQDAEVRALLDDAANRLPEDVVAHATHQP
jgi:predicted phosphoribosyltransferase